MWSGGPRERVAGRCKDKRVTLSSTTGSGGTRRSRTWSGRGRSRTATNGEWVKEVFDQEVFDQEVFDQEVFDQEVFDQEVFDSNSLYAEMQVRVDFDDVVGYWNTDGAGPVYQTVNHYALSKVAVGRPGAANAYYKAVYDYDPDRGGDRPRGRAGLGWVGGLVGAGRESRGGGWEKGFSHRRYRQVLAAAASARPSRVGALREASAWR